MKASFIRRFAGRRKLKPVTPREGYDQWASTYDSQPENAVLALETRLFDTLLAGLSIEGKSVADIGCGTGRHWSAILSRNPLKLIGADPSNGMLERLRSRYPDSRIICAEGDDLS